MKIPESFAPVTSSLVIVVRYIATIHEVIACLA
jgi:hypothetical protein